MDADPGVGAAVADAVVDEGDVAGEPRFRRLAVGPHLGAEPLAQEVGEERIVDLDVAAAGGLQRRDLLPVDARHVGEEGLDIRIGGLRDRPAPAVEVHPGRRGHRDLRRAPRRVADHGEVGDHDVVGAVEGAYRADVLRHVAEGVILRALEARVGAVGDLDPAELADEVDPPVLAPELAIRDDVQSDILLEADRLADALVLDPPELVGPDLADGEFRSCEDEFAGAEQAADLVGSEERLSGLRVARGPLGNCFGGHGSHQVRSHLHCSSRARLESKRSRESHGGIGETDEEHP